MEVEVEGGQKLLLEVPELRDPADKKSPPFNDIRTFGTFYPNDDVALVVYQDDQSKSAGYDGSVRAIVSLEGTPVAGYSARRNLDNSIRTIIPPTGLQDLDNLED